MLTRAPCFRRFTAGFVSAECTCDGHCPFEGVEILSTNTHANLGEDVVVEYQKFENAIEYTKNYQNAIEYTKKNTNSKKWVAGL